MQKKWVLKTAPEAEVQHLQEALKIHPVLCRLLASRGIYTYDEARTFFRPEPTHLHDPFLMTDMLRAVERIEQAMQQGEKILIFGDYDVDGTTSVALLYSFFRTIYPNHIDYYVPNRYTEGYGISNQGIDFAAEKNFRLIIALDCGIKSVDKIDYANQRGIDFIICDHHTPGDIIPAARAVLDPKRKDCAYPFKELSGCGVGFKLLQAYGQRNGFGWEALKEYLDLVVVSIGSDIVPIVGENRTLAFFGLKKINENPSQGIKALKEIAGVKRPMSIADIVFMLGPRINAAGRMDDARHAVRLLLSESNELATSHAGILNQKNIERKEADLSTTEEALSMLESVPGFEHKRSTVLYKPGWHKGVIGIVASRLMDTYYRPTIILTESNGHVAGSARSVQGFNIYEAIKQCEDLLEQYGGHFFAAGLTMQASRVPAFIQRFEEVVAATITEKSLVPEIILDAELEPADITPSFFRIMNQFAPFGPENMKPVFLTRQMQDTGWSRIVGEHHLKLSMHKGHSPTLSGIAFGMHQHLETIAHKKHFDVCYTLEENEWQGDRKIELNVKDIR